MRTTPLLLLSVCAATFLALYGCAKLQDSPPVPVAPGIAVHPPGFADTTSPDFHGHAIRTNNWDMRPCRTCHGQTYAGGAVQVSCRTCHTQGAGPENCTTCHGGVNAAPPEDLSGNRATTVRAVGAHQAHLVGPRSISSTPVVCADCHQVPASVYDAGHVDSPLPAEVPLTSGFSRLRTGGITPAPSYDPGTQKCSSTFCHGTWRLPKPPAGSRFEFIYVDSVMEGSRFAPVWTGGDAQAACGTCHGTMVGAEMAYVPKGHVVFLGLRACVDCHAGVIDINGNVVDRAKHINGKVNVFGEEHDFR
jgi:hypothetical protein